MDFNNTRESLGQEWKKLKCKPLNSDLTKDDKRRIVDSSKKTHHMYLDQNDDKKMIDFWLSQNVIDLSDQKAWTFLKRAMENPVISKRNITEDQLKLRWVNVTDHNLQKLTGVKLADRNEFAFDEMLAKSYEDAKEKVQKGELGTMDNIVDFKQLLHDTLIDIDGYHWISLTFRLRELREESAKKYGKENVLISTREALTAASKITQAQLASHAQEDLNEQYLVQSGVSGDYSSNYCLQSSREATLSPSRSTGNGSKYSSKDHKRAYLPSEKLIVDKSKDEAADISSKVHACFDTSHLKPSSKPFDGIMFHVLRSIGDHFERVTALSDEFFIQSLGGIIVPKISDVDDNTICIASENKLFNDQISRELGANLFDRTSLKSIAKFGKPVSRNDFAAYRYAREGSCSNIDFTVESKENTKSWRANIETQHVERTGDKLAKQSTGMSTKIDVCDYRDWLDQDKEDPYATDSEKSYDNVNRLLREAANEKEKKDERLQEEKRIEEFITKQNSKSTGKSRKFYEEKRSKIFAEMFRCITPNVSSILTAATMISSALIRRRIDKNGEILEGSAYTVESVRAQLKEILYGRLTVGQLFDKLKLEEGLTENQRCVVDKFFREKQFKMKVRRQKHHSYVSKDAGK